MTRQRIVIVTAPRATRVCLELRGQAVLFVANPGRAAGLSTSVARGLRKTRFSAATLFLPVDLPELDPRDIRSLISRWRGARRRVVARGTEGRASTPLILPKFLYPLACGISGDIGLRDLVAELRQEQRTLVELPSAVRDIDTPQDLYDARCRAARRIPISRP